MNQHTFVKERLAFYEEQGLTPEPGGEWQEAHYPDPEGIGDKTVRMTFDDHQQQGLYQSEEYGRCCFFSGDVVRFLTHSPFVPGWFDLWDLYGKWRGDNGRKNGPKNSVANFTLEMRSDNGRKTATSNLLPNCSDNGRKTGKRVALTKISTGEVFEFSSAREAARILGLHQSHLSKVAKGKKKQHKGYTAIYL